MTAAAETFFEEATPPQDIEWTASRARPEVSPQSPRPWFVLLAAVALGVTLRVLAAVEVLTGPSILYGVGWGVTLAGCAFGTLVLARSRDAVTSRHVADAAMLGIATGGFAWLFPHFNGIEVIDLLPRIGVVATSAGAGVLVGALIVLALARARTSVATVSFLVSCLLVLIGAFLFQDEADDWIGLGLLIGAWTFAIAGWNDRAGGPRQRPPDSATLRSPRSMVSFATAACAAFAIRESFRKDVWANELPAILLLGLMFIAALVSVFDARRQMAATSTTINNWSEWRASVETGVYDGPTEGQEVQPDAAGATTGGAAAPAVGDKAAAGYSLAGTVPTTTVSSGTGDDTGKITAVDRAVADPGPTGLAWPSAPQGDTAQPSDNTKFIPVPANTATNPISAPGSTQPFPARSASDLETFPAASAWTVDGDLLGANAAFWDISESEPSDGFSLLRIVHPEDRPALALQITRGTRTNLPFKTIVRLVEAGSPLQRRVDIAGGPYQPTTSPLGEVANASYQVSVNTPQPAQLDEAITTIGLFDPLTGLGNAAYLEQWLAKRTAEVRRRTDRPLLVVFELTDLGNYERSEPRLRDVIMTEAAHALHTACRAGDFVVRLDGPYFAAIVAEVLDGDEWYVLTRFEEIVKGTFKIAGRPFKIDGRLLPLRPNPGASLDDILDQVATLLVAQPPSAATTAGTDADPDAATAASSDDSEGDGSDSVSWFPSPDESSDTADSPTTGENNTNKKAGAENTSDKQTGAENTTDKNTTDKKATGEITSDENTTGGKVEPMQDDAAATAPAKAPGDKDNRQAASMAEMFLLAGHAVPPGADQDKSGIGPTSPPDNTAA